MIESGRRRSLGASIILYLCLGVYLLVVSFPYYYMALTSLRTQRDVYNREDMLTPRNLTLNNYIYVVTSSKMMVWTANSVKVGLTSTALALVISTLAAYALARLRFFASQSMAKLVLFMYLIPNSLIFIPLFLIMLNLKLINSLWSLVLSYQTFNVPFMTWLLLGYFRSIPLEIEDAARIDGCSRPGLLSRIVLPLALPGIVAAAIFGFVNSWNEFLYAAVMVQRGELRTIPVGLYSFQTGDVLLWGPLMAASLIATVPVAILFMFAQQYLVQGLTAGSVKG